MSNLREEIAWASGVFEGEGCIGCWVNSGANKYRGSRQIVARLVMTDPDVLVRFAEAFDILGFDLQIRKSGRLYGNERKIRYTISTNNYEKTQALVAAMWPWLGERRRQQASDALTKYQRYYNWR